MQAGGENERPPNDGAGAGLILQQLNMFFDRQEQFNERLEQKIVAFEEKSEKRRERKVEKLKSLLGSGIAYRELAKVAGSIISVAL